MIRGSIRGDRSIRETSSKFTDIREGMLKLDAVLVGLTIDKGFHSKYGS